MFKKLFNRFTSKSNSVPKETNEVSAALSMPTHVAIRGTVQLALLNRDEEYVQDVDGKRWPITNWIDFEGDECDPEDAICCVAGSEAMGWINLRVDTFTNVTVH